MTKAKRVLATGLVAVMASGMLTGCGGGGGDAGNTGGNASGGDSTASTSSSQSSDNTQSQSGNTGEIVNLKWVTIGNGMPTNYDSWISSVNAYIGEKIGVNLEMEVIPWGDWDNRRNIIVSTNEPYDIIFGNGNNYVADINLGAYADITDLISANMPEIGRAHV